MLESKLINKIKYVKHRLVLYIRKLCEQMCSIPKNPNKLACTEDCYIAQSGEKCSGIYHGM